jgi:putative oxidoreductase
VEGRFTAQNARRTMELNMPEPMSTKIPRIVLGLIFVSGSIDGFYYVVTGHELLHFPETTKAHIFTEGLKNSGFFWPFMKSIQLFGGLSLLFRYFAPIGFLLLMPVIATIVLFHFTINPPGAIFGFVLVIVSGALLAGYFKEYREFVRKMADV